MSPDAWPPLRRNRQQDRCRLECARGEPREGLVPALERERLDRRAERDARSQRKELPRVKAELRQGLEQARKELQAVRVKVRTGSVRM